MVACETCGKEVQDRRALAGHRRFVHPDTATTQSPKDQVGRIGLGDPPGRREGRSSGGEPEPVPSESPAWLIGDEIQLRFQEQQENLTVLMQGVAKLLDESGQIIGLMNKVDHIIDQMEIFKNQHPPGLCKEKTCSANCRTQLTQMRVEFLEIIEHRIPNTKQVLAQIDKAMTSGDLLDLPMESLHLADEVHAKNRSDRKGPADTFTLGLVKSIWG